MADLRLVPFGPGRTDGSRTKPRRGRLDARRRRTINLLERLEDRTLLASSVTVTTGGVVSVASSAAATVQLTYDSGTDTYTFDDNTNVSPGTIGAGFTYNQVSATEATLVPTAPATQDFTSLGFTSSASGITYDLNSLGHITSITGTSPDTVNIGSGGSVQGIGATVNLNSATTLSVDDSADSTARTITVNSNFIGGLAPGAINYDNTVTSLTIDGGTGGNIFNVIGTLPSGSTTDLNTGTGADTVNATATGGGTVNIHGQNGADTVTLGGSTSAPLGMQGLSGTINVDNAGALTTLTLDDSQDTTAQAATLADNGTTGLVAGLSPATISYTDIDLSGLTVKGGSGGNTFTVNGTPGGINTTLDSGTGADTVNVKAAGSAGTLDIHGQAGADTVTLGGSTSAPLGMQGLAGTINVDNAIGFTGLTLDNSQDTTAQTATITASSVTGLAPATINYTAADLSGLTVKGGSGGNTFTVSGTPGLITTTLDTGTGANTTTVEATGTGSNLTITGQSTTTDSVDLSNAGSAQGLNGTVGMSNVAGGSIPLTVDDSADGTAQAVTIGAASLSGSMVGTATVNYANLTSLTLKGGTGGNTFTVSGTPANLTTTLDSGTGTNTVSVTATGSAGTLDIHGQAGNDTVTLGGSALAPLGMQGLAGTINVDNAIGFTGLTLDDSQDTAGQTATITASSVTGLSPATINYTGSDLSGLTVKGGSGGNMFTVSGTPGGITTTLDSGTGTDTVNVTATGFGGTLDIHGQAGTDTVTLGGSTSAPLGMQGLLGTINLDNALSFTALTLDDSQDTVARTGTITASSVTGLSPATINCTVADLSGLTVDGGTGGNTFDVTGTAAGITTTLNSGTGDDTVGVTATGNGTLDIHGQGGADAVTLGNSATDPPGLGMQGLNGTINVDGAPASVALTLDDSQDATSRTITINGSSISGLSPATINWVTADLSSLSIQSGTAANTWNVLATTPGFTTTINTGSAGDTVNVLGTTANGPLDVAGFPNTVNIGDAGSVQGINGTVNLYNTTMLTVGDSANPQGETATINSLAINGLAPAAINYKNTVTSLTISGGTGGNAFTVLNTLPAGSTTTLNSGTGNDTVNVEATGGALDIHGQAGNDTVSITNGGLMSGIQGAISIDNVGGLTALTLDAHAELASHTFDLTAGGATSTFTNLSPAPITYTTADISPLTIDTGPSGTQVMNIDFSNGNPIPTATVPGLIFNAGADATSAPNSHALNLMGTLPAGPFAGETHNANDPSVFPQAGQYGSIDFNDSLNVHSGLDYTGLQPILDTASAVNYTFNDFADDQSFTATSSTGGGFSTIQFANTPMVGPPTFETTNVANKTNIVFNTPNVHPGAGLTGVVNVATASTGLSSLTFNTPTSGANTVKFLNTPPAVVTTLNGVTDGNVTNVTGTGVAAGTTLTLNGGGSSSTLNYDAGGLKPTITAGVNPGEVLISIPGAGTVDATAYQQINLINVGSLTITPGPAVAFSTVEGFQNVNTTVATFTMPTTGIFPLPAGFPASDFTASINWGDPSPDPSAGTVTQDASNPSVYYVTGTHTFATNGTYTVANTVGFSGGTLTGMVNGVPVSITLPPIAPTAGTSATATVTQASKVLVVSALPIVGTEGIAIPAGQIGSFIDMGGPSPIGSYSASFSIFNSSGTMVVGPLAGTVTQIGTSAQFNVDAPSFTLPEEGSYQVVVSVTDSAGSGPITVSAASTAVIADAALTASTTQPNVSTTEASIFPTPGFGTSQFHGPVASFVDGNTGAPVSDFIATIDWGDGSPMTAGTVVAGPPGSTAGTFVIDGSHTYADSGVNGGSGSYPIQVFVQDAGGSRLTLTNTDSVADNPITLTGSVNPATISGMVTNSPNVTNDPQPGFYGTSEPYSWVTVYATPTGGSPLPIGTAQTSNNGAWDIVSNVALPSNTYAITATAVDQFGVTKTAAPVTIMPNLVIDTVGPVVTAASFNRLDATLTVTFQDPLAGMDMDSMCDGQFYQLIGKQLESKIHIPSAILVTGVTVTPGATPTSPVTVNVQYHHGKELRGGIYLVDINSGTLNRGIEDNAANPLSGTFYGVFPSGNGRPGYDFQGRVTTYHHLLKPLMPVPAGFVPPSGAVIDPPVPAGPHADALKHANVRHATKAVTVKSVNRAVKRAAGTPPQNVFDQAIGALIDEVGHKSKRR
jgi:hypothetical protein